MKIETVILDWAGTTVDYGCMAPVAAFREAFRQHDIDVSTTEIREPMGMLKKDHIRYLLRLPNVLAQWEENYNKAPEEADVEKLYELFEEKVFQGLAEHSQLKPDVISVIKEIKELGISIGSTTGYTRAMMEVVEETAAKQGYIPDSIVTPDEVSGYGRPYPYMIFANMQKLGTKKAANVVKVGDTLADIEEGKCAGVTTVGIIAGSSLMGLTLEEESQLSEEEKTVLFQNVKEKYLSAGADYVIETILELPELVR